MKVRIIREKLGLLPIYHIHSLHKKLAVMRIRYNRYQGTKNTRGFNKLQKMMKIMQYHHQNDKSVDYNLLCSFLGSTIHKPCNG